MKEKSYDHTLRVAKYILQMRPVFNRRAVFSDETENFVTPCEPDPGDEVTIRIRTKKNNVDAVYLISGPMKERMAYEKSDPNFDFYTITLRVSDEMLRYYFELRSGRTHCFYNKLGITRDLSDSFAFALKPGFHTPAWAKGAVMYQILVDRFRNGDPSNDVLDHEYAYIHDHSVRITEWGKRPAAMDVREFYGGDLQGVMDKLDYLKDLGVEVIYFNPLFVSPSNHKYDTQDYDYIDPHLGKFVTDEGELLAPGNNDNTQAERYICRVTRMENLDSANAMFAKLVEACHSRGIRVILDGVFNHCGSFNKWMDRERIYENSPGYDKGAFVSENSPYRSFFHFTNEHEWPYNPFYDGWWGHETLPKLNYENSDQLEQYILDIAAKWLLPPYNADGWRLDVAADLGHSQAYNHEFWKKFRETVKTVKPDALIIAEHYGNPANWLQGDEWDTVMNYDAFMEPLTWFFTGMEKHSDSYQEGMLGNADSFMDAMRYNMASFMWPSLSVAMNELSNHDHSRFLTRTNHKVGRMDHFDYDAASEGVVPAVMREAIVMQMTWPGAPTLYYGDEAGVCGFTDPDNRRTYPWGLEDQEMLSFYKQAIVLHNSYDVFRNGSIIPLHGDYNIIAYGRFSEQTQMICVFNNNAEEKKICFKVYPAGFFNGRRVSCVFRSDAAAMKPMEKKKDADTPSADPAGSDVSAAPAPDRNGPWIIEDGELEITVPPLCAMVLKQEGEEA